MPEKFIMAPDGREGIVDERIADLTLELWKAELPTCRANIKDNWATFRFYAVQDAEKLIEIADKQVRAYLSAVDGAPTEVHVLDQDFALLTDILRAHNSVSRHL